MYIFYSGSNLIHCLCNFRGKKATFGGMWRDGKIEMISQTQNS